MCLNNEKPPNKGYKSVWKVFDEKKDGLHPTIREKDNVYNDGETYLADFGFHGFIDKKDAEDFVLLLKEMRKKYPKQSVYKFKKLVIKKVKISIVVKMGYAVTSMEDLDTHTFGDKPNALRFREMEIE